MPTSFSTSSSALQSAADYCRLPGKSFGRPSFCLLLCVWSAVVCHAQGQPADKITPEVLLFSQREIPLTPAGVRSVLAGLLPNEDGDLNATVLIAQLGSNEFAKREAAEKKILALPLPPIDELKAAKAGDNPEIRMRAAKLLTQLEGKESSQDVFLFASLLLIRDRLPQGMAAELLQLAPHCQRADLCLASWEAMRNTVKKKDQESLLKALRQEDPWTRAMAYVGMQAMPEADSKDWLEVLAEQDQPEIVRLAVTHFVAKDGEDDLQDKETLLELSNSQQEATKRIANTALEYLENDIRKTDWTDYLSAKLIRGEHDGQSTEFLQGVPQVLIEILPHDHRTANTIGPVSSRHGSSPWLYPKAEANEAPRILDENGQSYYPLYGTWKQQWGGQWITLGENGQRIGGSVGGRGHLKSVVEYLRWSRIAE